MLSNANHNFIEVYTDGSGNNRGKQKGAGGIGIVLLYKGARKLINKGRFEQTTTTRMELFAIVYALEQLNPGFSIIVYSDNQSVVFTVNKRWLDSWLASGMLYSKANPDLWMRFKKVFDRLGGHSKVQFVWVKGHEGNVGGVINYNEVADKLANEGRLSKTKIIDRRNGMVQIPIRSI